MNHRHQAVVQVNIRPAIAVLIKIRAIELLLAASRRADFRRVRQQLHQPGLRRGRNHCGRRVLAPFLLRDQQHGQRSNQQQKSSYGSHLVSYPSTPHARLENTSRAAMSRSTMAIPLGHAGSHCLQRRHASLPVFSAGSSRYVRNAVCRSLIWS